MPSRSACQRLGERSLAHGAPAPRRYGRSMWSLRPRTLPTGFVPPCLPTAVPSAPPGDQWWHEIKWDGIRVIARRKRENYPFQDCEQIGSFEKSGVRAALGTPQGSKRQVSRFRRGVRGGVGIYDRSRRTS